MAAVGLLFVGAVLIVNGLFLLGIMDPQAAAPLNLFVGALQVFTPTYLIVTSGGDPTKILAASGIYLFGFTYLYVGINLLGNLDGAGLGWYSIFVTACAVVFAGLNLWYFKPRDTAFTAIWLYWGFLWAMFWVILALKREEWTRYTGAIAIVAGIFTTAIPAFLLLTNQWAPHIGLWTTVLVVVEVLSIVAFLPLRSRYRPAVPAGVEFAEGTPEAGVPGPRSAVEEEARRRTPST